MAPPRLARRISWRRHEITFRPPKLRGEAATKVRARRRFSHPYLPPYSLVARRYSTEFSKWEARNPTVAASYHAAVTDHLAEAGMCSLTPSPRAGYRRPVLPPGPGRWRLGETRVNDPKRLVAESYDRVAERYVEWTAGVRTEERARYIARLVEVLPRGAVVLELGCGAGGPTTHALATHFQLTGVDVSSRSVDLARHNVPAGVFIAADMTQVEFPPESFDAVVAVYSSIHVPREDSQCSSLGSLRRATDETHRALECPDKGVYVAYALILAPVQSQRAAGLNACSINIFSSKEDFRWHQTYPVILRRTRSRQ